MTLAGSPGGIRGVVKDAPYAPVYLEPYDTSSHSRVAELFVTRTDAHGRYQFSNLAPGSYRLLSTFEYRLPDSEAMDAAFATEVQIDAHTEAAKDLELWGIR